MSDCITWTTSFLTKREIKSYIIALHVTLYFRQMGQRVVELGKGPDGGLFQGVDLGPRFSLHEAQVLAEPALLRMFNQHRHIFSDAHWRLIDVVNVFNHFAAERSQTAGPAIHLTTFVREVLFQVGEYIAGEVLTRVPDARLIGLNSYAVVRRQLADIGLAKPVLSRLRPKRGAIAQTLAFPFLDISPNCAMQMVDVLPASGVLQNIACVASDVAPEDVTLKLTREGWFDWFNMHYGADAIDKYVAGMRRARGELFQPSDEALRHAVRVAFAQQICTTSAGDVYFAGKPREIIGECIDE